MYCFTCKEDFESMMTCIYRVWEAKKGRQNVRLEIEPVEQLHGGTVDSCGDHRIAMCAAVAATEGDSIYPDKNICACILSDLSGSHEH